MESFSQSFSPMKVDGQKGSNWTVEKTESGRTEAVIACRRNDFRFDRIVESRRSPIESNQLISHRFQCQSGSLLQWR